LEVIVRTTIKVQVILFLLVICIPLIACGGADVPAETEEVLPTIPPEVESELEVTDEPGDHGKIPVTDLNQIEGLWIAEAKPEIFYLQIFTDGRVEIAPSLADLEKGSINTWTLRIEEDIIYAEDFDLCLGEVGSYFGQLNPDGTLKFISIIDSCAYRLRHLDKSLPGRLYEYNLVYSLIE
jgi:hypothetical protein